MTAKQKSITGREFRITANYSKRTFTIRVQGGVSIEPTK